MDRVKAVKTWLYDFRRGLRCLSRHNPEVALKFFRSAIKDCPVGKSRELAKILYYTGVALKKIGCHDGAVKSWKTSYRIRKFRFSDRQLRVFSNEYGMYKQGVPELDDWRAFYSVQLGKYLRTKKSRSLGTLAEQDMIRDLIYDAWRELYSSRRILARSAEDKLAIFRSVEIVFPYFYVPSEFNRMSVPKPGGSPAGGLCPCGSGLAYESCCGTHLGRKGFSVGKF